MHSRFPEPLKPSILGAVQFRACAGLPTACSTRRNAFGLILPSAEVMGRLDHLVDAVYDRFKDRYFPEERMSAPPS
jgi:bromodomain adjacent to zinc finger domain protein 1A